MTRKEIMEAEASFPCRDNRRSSVLCLRIASFIVLHYLSMVHKASDVIDTYPDAFNDCKCAFKRL